MIAVVDYNLGNHGSILNMLRKIGAEAVISSEPDVISKADKIILPGVGAFDHGMANITSLGLIACLQSAALERRVSVLGICLGMHLMTGRSEEGESRGLGWIDGESVRFTFDPQKTGLRIPHMGWNTVSVKKNDSLFAGLDEPRFYFVHSYHVSLADQEDTLATTTHGYEFVSAFQRDNLYATQFHPEKSHRFGLGLLKNFAGLP